VVLGSIALAVVLVRISLAINARIRDVSTAVVFQFCSAFSVWILAEHLHLSAIITLVVFAMMASRRAPEVLPARMRIPAWAVWEVAVFVLNVLAFILVGFQLKAIAANLTPATGARYAAIAVAVCVVVILARIAWVTGAAGFSRWRCRPRADGTAGPRDAVALTGRGAAVVGWCGMRGTVTLAAALALPTDFPFRDLILATAFGVTLGTLVIQGLTLRPLLVRLGLEDDGSVEREVRLARQETARAGVAALDGSAGGTDTGRLLRRRYQARLGEGPGEEGGEPAGELLRRAVAAERRRLVALRADGTIGDDAFHRVEEELDRAELSAEGPA
jgi:CPA1 family monovalent cation:H+ antiporter